MRFRTLTCFWLSCFVKTRRPNIHCRDAHFCRQQEQTCGQRQSSYTLNSTVARRNWRRRLQSSCRLDSQCSGDREEEEEEEVMLLGCPVFGRMLAWQLCWFCSLPKKSRKRLDYDVLYTAATDLVKMAAITVVCLRFYTSMFDKRTINRLKIAARLLLFYFCILYRGIYDAWCVFDGGCL